MSNEWNEIISLRNGLLVSAKSENVCDPKAKFAWASKFIHISL